MNIKPMTTDAELLAFCEERLKKMTEEEKAQTIGQIKASATLLMRSNQELVKLALDHWPQKWENPLVEDLFLEMCWRLDPQVPSA